MISNKISRRVAIKSSAFGLLAASIPNVLFAKNMVSLDSNQNNNDNLFYRYPSIDDEIVSEVVGKSHFDLDRVKELVDIRPELSRATWDWSFGDWESAVGAASHVGRRDIVLYLLENGARPNIFTMATLGKYKAVKFMIEALPGIQKTSGPHGISLLRHAESSLRMKDIMSATEIEESEKLISYLESLGDADGKTYESLKDDEKDKYLGDYMYGDGETDGFSVKLNMRKMIALGKLGSFGGGLHKIAEHTFLYNGVSSVTITFQVEDNIVKSLTVTEPDMTVVAKKI